VPRLMEPYEHLIPRDKTEDYEELKDKGLLQMVRIYNLLFGGSFLADDVSGKPLFPCLFSNCR
jgi:hypothetical protein